MQKVCCVFLVKATKLSSVLRLYRSAEESLLQKKMRVRDMKNIQQPFCFEMEYFIDYSFDFASASTLFRTTHACFALLFSFLYVTFLKRSL